MFRSSLAAGLALVALLPAATSAATFTVGPGGTHSTIQSAITSALIAPGDDEIRVATGTYAEALYITAGADERTTLDGGWDASFTTRTLDPALTVVDAAGSTRVFNMEAAGGVLEARNFSFIRGAFVVTAGVAAVGHNDAVVTLEDCIVRDSFVSAPDGGTGVGGVGALAYDSAQVTVRRCAIHDNTVDAGAGTGGGLEATALGSGRVVLEGLRIHDNSVIGVMNAYGGGMRLTVMDAGQVDVTDVRVFDNTVNSPTSSGAAGIQIDHDPIGGSGDARITLRRVAVVGNEAIGDFRSGQLDARVNGSGGRVLIGDTLVADGIAAPGLQAFVAQGSTLQLVNITAAGNTETDLRVSGVASISNSLADTTLFGGESTLDHNLFGTDPGYLDRAAGDYRLPYFASPAVNAGTSSPTGGLGAADLDGNARVDGPGVDLGAFEAEDPTLFVDGFETP